MAAAKMSDSEHIIMLVIGETGAGKSTLINAVANYLKFGSLEEAVQAGGEFPIPFQLTDPQSGQRISISSEDDSAFLQDVEVGKSVTKVPNEYVFQYTGGLKVHMIDTPGLLDTEDTSDHSVDKQHVNNILRLLSSYQEIHAICIALKSTVNRLSEALKYTLTELMKKLHASAVNNVIFTMTYASGIVFQPRSILEIVQTFLNKNNLDIPLPPTKETVYCFENGTVNYLAQCRHNIAHTEYVADCAHANFKMSKSSTKQMIDYVCELKPVSVESINAIYNADHTIAVLSELVLAISLCSYKNVAALERKEKEAEVLREKIRSNPLAFAKDDIKQLLVRTEWTVVNKPLGHKDVVCGSEKCTKVTVDTTVEPPIVAKYHPQICCRDCRRPWISVCDKMTWLGKCKACECEKSKHSLKTTEQEVVKTDVPVGDASSVIEKVMDSNDALKAVDRTISEYVTRVEAYINETDHMLSTCAKLNSFVQQNALMATSDNDEMAEKLQNKIQWCKAAGGKAATELKYLSIIENYYKKAKEECRSQTYSPSDVGKLIQELYGLELKGRELKEAMEVETNARKEVIKRGRSTGVARMIYWFD